MRAQATLKSSERVITSRMGKIEIAVNAMRSMAEYALDDPEKGHWYETYVGHQKGSDTLVTKQLGSEEHDYFQMEWFKRGMTSKEGFWSNPYFDNAGGKTYMVSYCCPVFDSADEVVGVICADVSISDNNPDIMFITMFLGIMDLSTGTIRYCNAGHNPPIVIRNGHAEFLSAEPSLLLGVDTDAQYTANELTLFPGDTLFLYTDGLTEAENKQKELSVEATDGRIRATLIDSGAPFNPLQRQEANLDVSLEERQIGGLGIHLIKEIMNNIEYVYENGKNVLIMEKQIDN